ncbi:MAG: hypothetical protein GWN93_06720 [Deltaproteobacteria bacterium]|nr:hypothetical protein [Deltaproteobacteria bacterium]
MYPTPDPVSTIENTFGVTLKKVSATEYQGPCPWCGGTDRFHVWEKGNYWCRPGPGHCGRKGWVDKLDGQKQLTQEALTELRLQRLERKQEETDRRLAALERMARCQDHLAYHQALTDSAVEWWHTQGINDDSISRYTLGYCPRCPTDSKRRPSYTIPVVNGGQLFNIRHRLTTSENGDKYRPHMPGLGSQLFNTDFLHGTREIIIVEGCKKSIVLDQHGFPNVAIMGKRSFKREWKELFADLKTVYVALDPDAKESAFRLARIFDGRGKVINLPVKPDDFFSLHGGTVDGFADFIKLAQPVRC